jgi:hypothetical protein
MLARFVPKFNLYICKIVLSITLFCVLYFPLQAQNKTANRAVTKKEQLKKAREEEYERSYRKALKHQFRIQGKQAQKRMKKDKRITNNYYNKKLGNNCLKRYLFNRKRRK